MKKMTGLIAAVVFVLGLKAQVNHTVVFNVAESSISGTTKVP